MRWTSPTLMITDRVADLLHLHHGMLRDLMLYNHQGFSRTEDTRSLSIAKSLRNVYQRI